MNATPWVSKHSGLKITRKYVLKNTVEFCDHKTFVVDRKASKCVILRYV